MNINQISPPRKSGDLTSSSSKLNIETNVTDSATELYGKFDSNEGKLLLSIPGIGVMSISGFLSSHDIGYGETGKTGVMGSIGNAGNIGNLGEAGLIGFRGLAGQFGEEGQLGETGEDGNKGYTGSTGPTGATGDNGVIPMYMQVDQPENLAVGTIWVKLPEVEALDTEEDQ